LISLTVYGRPAPQGSKRHVGNGRMIEMSKHVGNWRDDVRAAALVALTGKPSEPLDGPLVVRMIFTIARPAAAKKRLAPHTMPDLSKLARATEDALTSAGLWADDARVVEYTRLAKVYPGADREALDRPGAYITVDTLAPNQP
jgi:Holliday junction resolvase RusA-like endonuclease